MGQRQPAAREERPGGAGRLERLLHRLGRHRHADAAGELALRANGASAWIGWPDIPHIEALREAWFDAPDLAAQQKIAREIQATAFEELPYLPLGQYLQATAYSSKLTGVLNGFVLFWNVRKEG